MTLVAPAHEAPAELSFDQALELRRDLHRARVKLVKRNTGRGCDRVDVWAVERIEEEWLALAEELRADVDLAFRRGHPCPGLAKCSWWSP